MEKLQSKAAISSREAFINQNTITPRETTLELFEELIRKGGPEVEDYDALNTALSALPQYLENGIITKEELERMISMCDFLQTTTTFMGHSKLRPFGYAGDFAIIEKIYNQSVCDRFGKWDIFSNKHHAAIAVRNRKTYFKNLLSDRISKHATSLRLLNIASGPARDLFELYTSIYPDKLHTTCIELDKKAIAYAEDLCKDYLNNITFLNRNVIRFNTEEQYDIVWSAGLFDYFNDVTFVHMLGKFIHEWAAPDGEVIIGNFSTNNPSRPFMELFGDWHLIHRTPDHLYRLALEAGAEVGNIFIDKEPMGVNLFLRIKK